MKLKWGLAILLALLTWKASLLLRPSWSETVPFSQAVYDDSGQLLRLTLSKDEKYRSYFPLEAFPASFVELMLFKEDRYFYFHFGINPIATVKAAVKTLLHPARPLGASTITMQLARLKYDLSTRSVSGKLQQMFLALWIEFSLSKKEILEAYLNLLPFGGNIEGVGAASLIYFSKTPQKLGSLESFALAVIPQNPNQRGQSLNPALLKAQQRLYQRWAQSAKARGVEPETQLTRFRLQSKKDLPFEAPHFTQQILSEHPGEAQLFSTLNRDLQKQVERILQNYIKRVGSQGIQNAAAMLVDWTTHEIKAQVGSANFFDPEILGQVDVTQAFRSPGSTLKPFAFALAIDQGLIHSESMLKDSPASFGAFNPENFDRDFQGPLGATEALTRSRNLPAVAIASELKSPTFYEFLKLAQIERLKEPEFYGLSPILGGTEVRLQDLARLYTMLPNQGVLRSLKRLQSESALSQSQLLSAESSQIILQMLSKTPRPDGLVQSRWSKKHFEAAWKTGTSQGFRDAWTAGVFNRYVLVVWVGNADGRSNQSLIGRDIAAPLFFEIAESIKTKGASKWLKPFELGLNLRQVEVCSLSGGLPGPHCPRTKSSLFIPGKSPITSCSIHRELSLDPKTGLRLCAPFADQGVKKVFEFWPSDLLLLFKQAGLPRKALPNWDPRCPLSTQGFAGAPPKITSPKEGIIYQIRATEPNPTQISLQAVTDGDVRETYWFVNNSLIGRGKSKEVLFWPARPGRHSVRVVDDQGRSAFREIEVQVVQ